MKPIDGLAHKFKWLLKLSTYVGINTLLLLGGLALSIFCTGWPSDVGSSIVASAIVGFLFIYQLLIDKRFDKAREIYEEQGLLGITSARSDKNNYEDLMRRSVRSFDILGHSLSRMYDDLGTRLLPEMSRRGVRIRILLLHPDSPFVQAREKEDPSPERVDLAKEIRKAAQAYQSLKLRNLQIRYYKCTPSITYQRIDNVVFAGSYFVGLPSGRQSALMLRADEPLSVQFQEHFEKIWDDFSETL